ncbi:MAG: MBOAT family protein [Candidatus Velthaea sp.]
MIFNTWTFAVFAVPALIFYWTLVPRLRRPHYLIAIGCIFYAWSVPAYIVLIAALAVVTFFIGRRILAIPPGNPHRKVWLIIGTISIVATLAFFKYSRFFAATVDQVARHHILPLPNIVVPLAISFFTFEFIHVLVDCYLAKITALDALDFAAFSFFFPTLVAGPIKRYQSFAPQVRELQMPNNRTLALNLYRVCIGIAKKIVIADSMARLTGPLTVPSGEPYGQLDFSVAILAYTAQIYFDFSGYSDIAIGVSGLLGFRIPENFDRPYRATNISVFWRRWHMSLSTWVRDYVFIPLGGSRRRPMIVAVNLFVAMAIVGLWHGAAWTFVIWGLWHGLGLTLHRLWRRGVVSRVSFLARPSAALTALSTALTFGFVMAGWVVFASGSLATARAAAEGALAFLGR